MARWLVVLLIVCLLPVTADASIRRVRQDGSGDYTTLGAALAAAAPNDLVLVGPGTYAESLTVTSSVLVDAEAGPEATFLDGLDSRRLVLAQGACTALFRGFTFRRARADEGAALLVWRQATVTVENCVFADNFATGSNAVQVRHAGTTLRVVGCRFLRNRATVHSGALSASMGANLVVDKTWFVDNKSPGHGAMNVHEAHLEMSNCLFLRNEGGVVGALTTEFSTGYVTGTTFHANSGTNCSVRLYDYVAFSRSLVSGEARGYGLETYPGTSHTCNLYFNDRRGACGLPLGAGEAVVDPEYCDAGADDFRVCVGSPALGPGDGCGWRGAFGPGCGCAAVMTEPTTWGALKSLYR